MGPTQEEVLRCLAQREGESATVSSLSGDLRVASPDVHSALLLLVGQGLVVRRGPSGFSVYDLTYALTPLGERMAEELGEE